MNKQMWYSFWWHLGTCTWPPRLADQISPALTSQRTPAWFFPPETEIQSCWCQVGITAVHECKVFRARVWSRKLSPREHGARTIEHLLSTEFSLGSKRLLLILLRNEAL